MDDREQLSITPVQIIDFWYSDRMAGHWYRSNAELDGEIRDRFASVWRRASDGELDHWRETAEGCLALCIVLDQFPLNMFRGQAESFATEEQAVRVVKHALAAGLDKQLPYERREFLYMPLMHSESLADQEMAVKLFEAAGLDSNLKFARHHRDIIHRFGRFPHRNEILGRTSSEPELVYLAGEGAFRG